MGVALSFLPGWLRGPTEDEQVEYEIADDPNAGVEGPSAREAISAAYKIWMDSFEKKNFVAISLLYTRDCKICPSSSRTAFGREECVMGWESLLKSGVVRVAFSNTTIEMSTNATAVAETSEYHMYSADSKPIDSGKHMTIWRNIKGKWFIHLHIFSSNKGRQKNTADYIREVCLLWEHFYFSRDFQSLEKLYLDDSMLCPPAWPLVQGDLAIQRFWARFPSMGVDRVDRTPVLVEDMGPGHASVEIRYTMYDYRSGVIDMGKSLVIFKKSKDGRWCIHTEAFNSDASIPTVSAEDETRKPDVEVGVSNV